MRIDRPRVWHWAVPYGRQGTLEAQFWATDAEVEAMCGISVSFDEPFGKHSYAEVVIARNQFREAHLPTSGYIAGHDLVEMVRDAIQQNDLYGDTDLDPC